MPIFTKDVAWLEPYYKAALVALPKRKVLTKVSGYKVQLEKLENSFGSCSTSDDKNYRIAICTHVQELERKQGTLRRVKQHRHRYIDDILIVFAHELAHMVHWEHTPKHWDLQHRISRLFTKVMVEQGVSELVTRKVPK